MDPSLHYARRARGHEPFYLKRLLFANFSCGAVQPGVESIREAVAEIPQASTRPAGKG
jgi:hypothetical protein